MGQFRSSSSPYTSRLVSLEGENLRLRRGKGYNIDFHFATSFGAFPRRLLISFARVIPELDVHNIGVGRWLTIVMVVDVGDFLPSGGAASLCGSDEGGKRSKVAAISFVIDRSALPSSMKSEL